MKTEHFGDKEFDILLELLLPFDVAFPSIQMHLDRLIYELVTEHDANVFGNKLNFADYRNKTINARKERGEITIPDKLFLLNTFVALAAVLRRVPMQFPQFLIYSDRVMFEISNSLDPRYNQGQTFEQFHMKNLLESRVFNSKMRGVGQWQF